MLQFFNSWIETAASFEPQVTLPPPFNQRERATGLEFCLLGRGGQWGWRGALQGEGLGELGGRLPAEARVGSLDFILGAPGSERGTCMMQGRKQRFVKMA